MKLPIAHHNGRAFSLMKSIAKVKSAVTCAGIVLAVGVLGTSATSAQTTGASATSCTQSGTTMSCTLTTQYTLPSGVNLQAGSGQSVFTLTGAASNSPQCSGGMIANPSTISAGTQTQITLSLLNCPTSGVSYSWGPPAIPNTNPASTNATHSLAIQTASASQTYSATVCSTIDASNCSTYSTSVTATGTVATPLGSCSISGVPSGTVAVGSSYTLSVQCAQGTISSRQWRLNGNPLSGATASSYTVPSTTTTAGASLNYSVVLVGTDNSAATPSATINVASPVSNACSTTGSVGTTLSYSAGYVALNGIVMGGNKAVYIIAMNVAASDTSVGKEYLPNYIGANSPVTGFSNRTVSVSPCPNDFTSADAQIVSRDGYDFSVSFTTEASRAGGGTAFVMPGRTYYINIRNDGCGFGGVCSLDGQYRNWNR